MHAQFRFFFVCVKLGDSFASCPFGSEFSGATEIQYFLQSRKGWFGGKNPVLLSVACPFCVLLFRLSCLLDTIASVSNCNLIQMIIRLITEGSEWPGYNLIIKSKGRGLRFISINCLIAINFHLTPQTLNYSVSRESLTRSNYLLILLQLFSHFENQLLDSLALILLFS